MSWGTAAESHVVGPIVKVGQRRNSGRELQHEIDAHAQSLGVEAEGAVPGGAREATLIVGLDPGPPPTRLRKVAVGVRTGPVLGASYSGAVSFSRLYRPLTSNRARWKGDTRASSSVCTGFPDDVSIRSTHMEGRRCDIARVLRRAGLAAICANALRAPDYDGNLITMRGVRAVVGFVCAAFVPGCVALIDFDAFVGHDDAGPALASEGASLPVPDGAPNVGDGARSDAGPSDRSTGPDALASSCSGATICDDFSSPSLGPEWTVECPSSGGAYKLENGALVASALPSGNVRFCRIQRAISTLTRFTCVIDWSRTLPAKRDDTYNHQYFAFGADLSGGTADIVWLTPGAFNAGAPNSFSMQEYHTNLGYGGSTGFSINGDVTKTERWQFTIDYPAASFAIARDTASGTAALGSMALTRLIKPVVKANLIIGFWYREPGPAPTTDSLSYDFIRCDPLP